jgi:hypothetical protein
LITFALSEPVLQAGSERYGMAHHDRALVHAMHGAFQSLSAVGCNKLATRDIGTNYDHLGCQQPLGMPTTTWDAGQQIK